MRYSFFPFSFELNLTFNLYEQCMLYVNECVGCAVLKVKFMTIIYLHFHAIVNCKDGHALQEIR
jgi:hypothetical protein